MLQLVGCGREGVAGGIKLDERAKRMWLCVWKAFCVGEGKGECDGTLLSDVRMYWVDVW